MLRLGQSSCFCEVSCESALSPLTDIVSKTDRVRKVPIVLQKSKIGRHRKSRESRILGDSAAAILVTPIRSSVAVFLMSDEVPHISSHENASAVLENFVRHPQKTFATVSANRRHRKGKKASYRG